MNPKTASLYNPENLVDPNLAAVIDLLSTACSKTAMDNGKYYRTKQGRIARIKRAIDEDAEIVFA